MFSERNILIKNTPFIDKYLQVFDGGENAYSRYVILASTLHVDDDVTIVFDPESMSVKLFDCLKSCIHLIDELNTEGKYVRITDRHIHVKIEDYLLDAFEKNNIPYKLKHPIIYIKIIRLYDIQLPYSFKA